MITQRLSQETEKLVLSTLKSKLQKKKKKKWESLQCLNIERFKELFECRLRKGQGIINSCAFTLSAWAQRLPIKSSLWQSWLLQNTISYCFSILGQCPRATGAMGIHHAVRDIGESSSDWVHSLLIPFCNIFLLLWLKISNPNAKFMLMSSTCHVILLLLIVLFCP